MNNIKNCPYCGTEFVNKYRRKFCQNLCRSRWNDRKRFDSRMKKGTEFGLSEDPFQQNRMHGLDGFLERLKASGKVHR